MATFNGDIRAKAVRDQVVRYFQDKKVAPLYDSAVVVSNKRGDPISIAQYLNSKHKDLICSEPKGRQFSNRPIQSRQLSQNEDIYQGNDIHEQFFDESMDLLNSSPSKQMQA